jgi:hypothetical protein
MHKITFLFFIFIPSISFSTEWYEDGTLHQASIQQWNNASYANRLATSGDWFVSMTKASNPMLQKNLDQLPLNQYLIRLKGFAEQLEKCTSDTVEFSKPSNKAAEMASICYATMYQ